MTIKNLDAFLTILIEKGGLYRTRVLPGTNELRREGLTYPAAKRALQFLQTLPATPDVMRREGSIPDIDPDEYVDDYEPPW